MTSPTYKHKDMAYHIVSVDGRSQIWKIDNGPGIARFCRDVLANENPAELQRYKPATAHDHETIMGGIAKARLLHVAQTVGAGFHPDTPISDYIVLGTGLKSFDTETQLKLESYMDFVFEHLAEDAIYETLKTAGL